MKKRTVFAVLLCGFGFLVASLVIIRFSGIVSGLRQPRLLMITSAVLPRAVLKEAYGGDRGFSVTAAGGVTPYSWAWSPAAGSTLPPGLKLCSNPDGTGSILGTPTVAGPYGVTLTVTDSESPVVRKSATYVITVADSSAPLHTVTGASPDAATTLTARDGTEFSPCRTAHDRQHDCVLGDVLALVLLPQLAEKIMHDRPSGLPQFVRSYS
jgi:hypothetical protein